MPLPEGERVVAIETRNIQTNEHEARIARDFLEWRRELRTIEDLGAFRTAARSLIVGNHSPERIQVAELTAVALRVARVAPLHGRALLESDETPGAPDVVVIGYDLWQRAFGGRTDVIGSVVKLGTTSATVVGVMPDGFKYPINHAAWTPLQLRAFYGALEGDAIAVIGRLRPGITRARADAEIRVIGERAAAALPATHRYLRPRVTRPGGDAEVSDVAELALMNGPVLLVLLIACTSVGTLVYARTATREGEIAVRSALGASRARIVGQLFVETLVLTSVAAAVGLIVADAVLRWGVEGAFADEGGTPFWITPGMTLSMMLYAGGLAVVSAAMLAVLPALRATRARVQPHLVNMGAGGATLRFGRVWTGAMVVQVALTTMAIPAAMEMASQTIRNWNIRAQFPSRDYLAAQIDVERRSDAEAAAVFTERRARTVASLEQRLAQEPGVVAVTFTDHAPGVMRPAGRIAQIETSPGAGPAFDYAFRTSEVELDFFETFDRPIVSGRTFQESDRGPAARSVIVNEAFVRGFQLRGGRGSPLGARLQYSDKSAASSAQSWFDIVGIVRDFGLDPNDQGEERPYVFHAGSAATISPLVMNVRLRGNPAPLVARLRLIAADVDAGLSVAEAWPLDGWIRRRQMDNVMMTGAQAGTALVLFLSALGIFSLLSVSVSRRTREIGLRAALGANPGHVLAQILSRAALLMGSGVVVGGTLVLIQIARWGEDVALFAVWVALTAAVMLVAGVLACVAPARRALRINATEALREA